MTVPRQIPPGTSSPSKNPSTNAAEPSATTRSRSRTRSLEHAHGIQITPATLADAIAEGGRLNDRDRWILDLLAEHRVLTAEQITRLGFDSIGRARRRLRLLHQRGVFARFRRCIRPGSQPWRYTLGPLGEALHAAHTGAPMPRPSTITEKIVRLAESRDLEHRLGVNDFFVNLIHHSRTHPHTGLDEWWSERRTAETTGEYIHPDAYGRWHETNHSQYTEIRFFLEYDRGSERLAVLTDKLSRYAHMTQARVNRPILFVFPNPTRQHNFTRHALRAGWPQNLTIATTAPDTTTTAASTTLSPAERIWLPLTHSHRCRLIDLATDQRLDHTTATPTAHPNTARRHPPPPRCAA